MPKRHVETFKGEDDQWYFTVMADNGEPIAQSEGYKDLRDMYDTLKEYFDNWDWIRRQGQTMGLHEKVGDERN